MRKESFDAALPQIEKYFSRLDAEAFTTNDLATIFEGNRLQWKIAAYRSAKDFIKFLAEKDILQLKRLKHLTTGSVKTVLAKRDATYYDVGLTIKKDGYLSNYTAMALHELTLQIPKTVYVSYMKNETAVSYGEINLTQDSIDSAFSKPQRLTSEIYKSEVDGYRLYFVQKNYSPTNIGVKSRNNLRFTDLERTILDITVRPAYSGGVFEVLEAYILAKKKINPARLFDYLNELNYIYPYHQLVGFYLDKAGYGKNALDLFSAKISKYDFYLTYNISNKEYDKKWRIFYPKGF
ncbi:type IV toxin-antitoxin system AbiEi family antitoxin domain-containing protein [Salinimicrobium sp. CAU 1759]